MVRSISEYRQAEIVVAAAQVMIEKGLAPISYDLIADQAGTSRQLIRHYYPNPEDLMIDMVERISNWYKDLTKDTVAQLSDADQLPYLLDFYFDLPSKMRGDKPKDDKVLDALVALSASSPAIKTRLFGHYASIKDQLAQAIKRAHPRIEEQQADVIGFQIVCLIYGHWKMVASLEFSNDFKHVSREAAEQLILNGV